MQKTVPGLVAVAAMACCAFARASTVASVIAVAQPAWIQLDDIVSELDRANDISIDDRILTGASGRAEIQLWSDVILRLYPESEIRLMPAENSAETADQITAELFLQSGKICLQSGPPTRSGRNFELNVDMRMRVTIHQSAHVCVFRREGLSYLGLLAGSVQISNSIEPGLVILSEAGIGFRLTDDGSYQLLPPGSGEPVATLDVQPFITEQEIAASAEEPSQLESADETATAENETTDQSASGSSIYTVYLFSTRSEEAALEANQRFQLAGHDTRIVINEKEEPIRYRIAVSGFTSR
ncbi:MAG: hypothetical protein JSU67_03065, partial [Gammaproteobacteria bacterium]